MKVYKLFQFGFSAAEKGLWWDHDEREYRPEGWGVVFKLFAGAEQARLWVQPVE